MAIVERFDGFVNYLYPMLINTSRQHRVMRDTMLEAMFAQYRLFHGAGDMDAKKRFLAAWTGHARWANSFNLLNYLGVSA